MTIIDKIDLSVKTLFRTAKNSVILRFKKNLKLNLGAGGTRIGEYVNVDSLFMRETDLLCKLTHLPYFVSKNSVSHIYISHVFEHFTIKDVKIILKMSYDLLQEGGEIRISVPDFDKIISLYITHKEEFLQKDPIYLLGVIFGGQSTRYDFHKTGFNAYWLKQYLEEAGFKNIQEYDAEIFLQQFGVQDSSLYKKGFGEYISLNMIANK